VDKLVRNPKNGIKNGILSAVILFQQVDVMRKNLTKIFKKDSTQPRIGVILKLSARHGPRGWPRTVTRSGSLDFFLVSCCTEHLVRCSGSSEEGLLQNGLFAVLVFGRSSANFYEALVPEGLKGFPANTGPDRPDPCSHTLKCPRVYPCGR